MISIRESSAFAQARSRAASASVSVVPQGLSGSQINSVKALGSWDGGNPPLFPPVAMSPLQMIRYEIAMDPPGSTRHPT